MALFLNRLSYKNYSEKRIRRIMKRLGVSSNIRRKRNGYTKTTPQVAADNILNREFAAKRLNEKWLTDLT